MTTLTTSCKGCIFNIKEDDVQVSCELGILDNIKNNSSKCEVIDDDYRFDRVCQFKTKEEKTKEEVLKERYLKFNFIIIDTNLDKTLATLESVENLVTKTNTVVVATVENVKTLTLKLGNKANYTVTHYFEDGRDIFQNMDDALPKLKNGYTVVLHEDDEISREDLDKINEFVNIKMNKLALIENSPFIINTVIYKMLRGNKGGSSFKDKLVELQEEQEVNSMIFTWEDVDEDTSI